MSADVLRNTRHGSRNDRCGKRYEVITKRSPSVTNTVTAGKMHKKKTLSLIVTQHPLQQKAHSTWAFLRHYSNSTELMEN